MPANSEIHPIQSAILIALLFKQEARFSELNNLDIPSDQFNFHLKTLITNGYVAKSVTGYKLTDKGKEFANRFDTDKKVLERQAKISVLIHCTKKIGGITYYLMQERLKEPYFGFLGAISGKVRWGETASETAVRELNEETNLTGKPELIGIEHKLDFDKENNLLEDKFFFIFSIKDPAGKMKEKTTGGLNKWMTEKEIFTSGKTFEDASDVFSIFKTSGIKFIEKRFKVKKY